jgi:hypothetical protein
MRIPLAILFALMLRVPALAWKPECPFRLDLGAASTVGIWEISYEHQPYLPSEHLYDYSKGNTRTSKIGLSIGPRARLLYGRYFIATEFQIGKFEYRGRGNSSLTAVNLAIGHSSQAKPLGMDLSLVYQYFNAGFDGVDTLFVDHNLSSFAVGFLVGSRPEKAFRWRADVKLPIVIFTHIFDWNGVVEHESIISTDVLFGFRPRHSPFYLDLGYYFYTADNQLEFRKREVINSLLTIRHGLTLRVGYLM